MRDEVHDARILRLALLYEDAHDRLLGAPRDPRLDDPVRLGLASPGTRARLEARLARRDEPAGRDEARAALLDVIDVARAARAFYLRHEDRVHDPALALLFRALAKEKADLARAAEDALVALGKPPPARPRLRETRGDLPVWGRDAPDRAAP